ncbi:MAG TPA: nitrilase-related carbon-nitrogen hydrolase [Longimicrobiaceae bacterium]|nr:nitrilase-related carbon-nitrogen hydrolase [Longimicrobiaceae bacterium]
MSGGEWRSGRLRLRIEQFAPALGDPDSNLRRITGAQQDAARDGVDLLVTPELALTGYDLRDRTHTVAIPVSDLPFPALARGPDVVLGVVEAGPGFVPFNAALHLRRGGVLHRHRKVYLPTYGMFDEGRYFGAGDRVRAYDAGGGWRMGLLVCEDLWHPALTWLLAAAGASLVVVQSAAAGRGSWEGGASGGRFASWGAWEHLAVAAATAYGIYVALANRVGTEGGAVFAGGSMIVGPDGRVLARGDDLGEDRVDAELSLDEVARARRPYAHARDEDLHLVARELARLLEEGR